MSKPPRPPQRPRPNVPAQPTRPASAQTSPRVRQAAPARPNAAPTVQARRAPAAPAAYRPNPTPKVLQPKAAVPPPPAARPKPPGQSVQPKQSAAPSKRPAPQASTARPAVVQRFALSIHNLTEQSAIPFAEGGGKGGLIEGSKIPHMTHKFVVGPAANTVAPAVDAQYKPDNWVNKDDQTMTAIKTDIAAVADHTFRQALLAEFQRWTCKETIFESLLSGLFYESEAPAKWYAPGENGSTTVQIKDQYHNRQALVIHLVTMRAAIYWRENSMKLLNVLTVTLSDDSVVNPKWDKAKEEGRKMIKKKLLDRVAPPMTPPNEGGAADEFGVALFPALKNAAGFDKIIEKKNYGGKAGYEIIPSNKFKDGGKRGDVVLAYNHLRFALWTEWRGAYELYNF